MIQIIKMLRYKEMIKKAFKVDVNIVIVNKKKVTSKGIRRGYYRDSNKTIVIYKSDCMLKTLLHELTHAFQYKYMKYMMEDEELYRTTYDDNYWDRPIEKHARIASNSIYDYLESNGIDSIKSLDISNVLFNIQNNIVNF